MLIFALKVEETLWWIAVISVPTALLGLFKLWLEIKKLRLENKELAGSHSRYASAVVNAINFKYRRVTHEYTLTRTGGIEARRFYELEVLSGAVSANDYSTWVSLPFEMEGYTREVITHGSSKIDVRELSRDPTSTRFRLEFTPPVDKQIGYEIHESLGGGLCLTMEEALEGIRQRKWPTDLPYESHTYLCRHSVDRLTLRAIFPEDYAIGGDEHWDVFIGYTGVRDAAERESLIREGRVRFDEKVISGLRVLTVEFSGPQVGRAYWIKWLPPRAANSTIVRRRPESAPSKPAATPSPATRSAKD